MTPEQNNFINHYRMDAQEAKRISEKINKEGTAKLRRIAERRLAKAFREIERAANNGANSAIVKIIPLFAREQTRRFCWKFCGDRLTAANFLVERYRQYGEQILDPRRIFIKWG